ncbi:MAG TPA: nuclear transport factor 2 family protein [Polyangiaceae bacterium]|jgi:hypothetical protein|nr:nuclear transport factor 2 family protein [Polyangiaceae bacterium]
MDVVEVLAVQSVVAQVPHLLDARRWQELRGLFEDQVETDYTSLFGGEVQRQRADELVLGTWRSVISPLEATHHLLGPIDVSIRGRAAIAECHVQAYHRAPQAPGGAEWTVAGHYIFTLHRHYGGAWKIRKLVLQTSYQTGNRQLLAEAAPKA